MTDQPTTLEKDTEKVLTDLEKLQQLNQEYLDGWKRAKADYLNLKRDTEKEKMEIVQFANAGLLLELLPILDNLKTAMKHVPENLTKESWVQGFDHILRQFRDMLKTMGVEEIQTVGQTFNPEMHEAVAKKKQEGTAPHTILEESTGGYTIQGKVIRHAKVTVSE
ncbi:MAG: nucleotide exchange factor GrpE [Patescibacteria group bacterium]